MFCALWRPWRGGGNSVGGLSAHRDIIWLGTIIFFYESDKFWSSRTHSNKKGLSSAIGQSAILHFHAYAHSNFWCVLYLLITSFVCVHLVHTRANNTPTPEHIKFVRECCAYALACVCVCVALIASSLDFTDNCYYYYFDTKFVRIKRLRCSCHRHSHLWCSIFAWCLSNAKHLHLMMHFSVICCFCETKRTMLEMGENETDTEIEWESGKNGKR